MQELVIVDCYFYAFITTVNEIAKYNLARKVIHYPYVPLDPKQGPAITMKRSARTWNDMDAMCSDMHAMCSDTHTICSDTHTSCSDTHTSDTHTNTSETQSGGSGT